MVSEQKRKYMRRYNQRGYVKAMKAGYMRRMRAEHEKEASRNLVRILLDAGYEGLAYEYAIERAPEMLATIRIKRKQKSRPGYNIRA